MEIEDDIDNCTPSDVQEAAKLTTLNLLPQRSRKKYELSYKSFMDWRATKNTHSFSENVLLAYFSGLAEKYKSSSLWSQYSMLRSTLSIHNNINIEAYPKLRAFLKRKSEGYQPTKSKTFTPKEIDEFLAKAPDEIYLATKVVVIIGIMGACRTSEIHAIKVKDITDLNKTLLVTIPVTKTKTLRKFTITGKFYDVVQKYMSLRPPNVSSDSFLLNYQKGKCTSQNIGVNKISHMGRDIANYLKLPEAEKYTGHSFRRSSATILVDAGADITALKRHGGWKSTSVAEGYIDTSMNNKMDSANKIINAVQTSTSSVQIPKIPVVNENINSRNLNIDTNIDLKSPPFTIINYGTVNLYVDNKKNT